MLSTFRFHHVAMAVLDIDHSSKTLANLGFTPCPEFADTVDENLGVQLRFLRSNEEGLLMELVCGLNAASPVQQIIEKSGVGLYHMCFEVEDLDSACADLRKHGYRPISTGLRAKAFQDRRIQFLHNPACGLIELLEGER